MAEGLQLRLLGNPEVLHDGLQVTDLRSRKAMALLCYLAVTGRPHLRPVLVGLLWGEMPEALARNNLSKALTHLRQVVGHHLRITRQQVALDRANSYWLDVDAFEQDASALADIDRVQRAVELYRGDFLEGFYVDQSPAFEEWVLAQRAWLRELAMQALHTLAVHHTRRGPVGNALATEYTTRLLALEPWREEAHLQMMLLLAASGQRSAALAQYETCRQVLSDELGVEPSAEIQETYKLLLKGERPQGILLPPGAGEWASGPVGECPYRGLAAFREEDAPLFFGRESFSERLHEAVEKRPMVAVIVGSSGSGKSSAVFAGLLPRLRASGETGEWLIADFRPGARPFQALAGSLVRAMSPGLDETERLVQAHRLDKALRAGDLHLADAVEHALGGSSQARRLLLVADQFEELYTLCPERETRRRFLDELLAAMEAAGALPEPRLVLLLAIRADFMGRALAHRPFADALQDTCVMLGPMNREELRAAVEKPALVQRAAFEAGLVERILDDVGQEPGNLPLLEFALTLLWERQSYGWLTHAGYEEIGRAEGALACYASEVFGALDPEAQEQARRVFVQLVRPGEGTEDTRRQATRAEVGKESWGLVQHLAGKRLVVTGRDAAGTETVEVVHEALIQGWGQLQDWIEADRAFRTWQERLRAALRQWQETGKDKGAMLRGAPLAEAEGWLAERGGELSEAEKAFVEEGLALREQRALEREARRQRELEAARALAAEQEKRADAEQRRAEEKTRSAGRLRQRALLLAGASVLAVILAVAAFYAFRQANRSAGAAQVASTQAVSERYVAETARALEADQRAKAEAEGWARATQQAVAEAETNARATQQAVAEKETSARATQQALAEGQARLATSRELSLAAQNNLQADPERSMLLALQAISLARTTQAEEALRQAVVASRVRLTTESMEALVESVAYSPDGSRLATGTWDGTAGTVFVRDATSGEVLLTVPGEIGIYSPDGARMATATDDGTVTIRDGASGQELLTLPGHGLYLSDLVFSPDGAYLATASCDGTVHVWDGTTGQEVLTLPVLRGDGGCIGAAFRPGGKHLITGGAKAVLTVWDLTTREALLTLPGGTLKAISPDGKLLVTTAARPSERLALWDLEASLASGSGQAIYSDARHGNIIEQIRFSPDGARLATGSQDRTAKVWTVSPEGIQESMTLAGHSGTVYDMAFSPDGRFLATGSKDGTARIWDISPTGNQELLTLAGHNNWLRRVAYSPDGVRLVTTNGDGQAVILDAETGETLLTFPHPAGAVQEAVFSPDGTRLATAGSDNTARVWDATNGQELLSFTGHAEAPLVGNVFAGIMAVAFSPDGEQLASAGADGQALIWDAETGEILLALQVHPAGIGATMVAFSPDGTLLAAASDSREGGDGLVSVWDLASGQVLYTVTGLPNRAHDLAFSPDGTKLAIGEYGDFLKLYDAASGEEVLSLTSDCGRILSVAFSPDGALLATGGGEPPRLWDLATGQELATFAGHTGLVWGLAFSPDGTRLASASYDGTTRVYAVDVEELIALAQSRLTRWWTPEECRQYLHTEECPPEP